jgi:hypothetical protein
MPLGGNALGLVGAVVCIGAGLSLMGMGLLRVLGWRGNEHALWPASLSTGTAAAVVLCSLPLAFGLGAKAQSMALVVGLLGLGSVAILVQRASMTAVSAWVALGLGSVPVAGGLAAALPALLGNAWTVAGHDLDTLQHQDGALHAMISVLVGEGIRGAPGYPLGLHAVISALSSLMDLDVFQSFAAVTVALTAVTAAGAMWAGGALGLGPLGMAMVGLLTGLHPLLLFAGMEQFAPQLVASALVPAALAAAVDETAMDNLVARAVLPALLLGATLSAYGLALSVAAPVVLISVLGQAPLQVSARRAGVVLLLAAALSPLGVFRTAERLLGGGEGVSPVKATQRIHDAAPEAVRVLSPDVTQLGDALEARTALRWGITAAHILGVSPYRDHFLRTSRLVATSVGASAAGVLNTPLSVWAGFVVPLGGLALMALFLVGLFRRAPPAAPWRVGGIAWVIVGFLSALWLGAGTGINPYYGFKLGSLCVGLIMVGVMMGACQLVQGRSRRVTSWVMAGLLVTRLPATAAVELEYARGLALDSAFVKMVRPVMAATRNRTAFALDGSPTRRYWESRLMLARAREVETAVDADVLLCARDRDCPLEDNGRLVLRSGAYSMWAR